MVPILTASDSPHRPGLPRSVDVVEVGARDGLQNEAVPIATETKLRFVHDLAAAGLRSIEVSSFVRPDRVPQLADASELFRSLQRREGVRYFALVPNPKGLELALAAGCRDFAVFTAASETFNRRNINRSIAESLADIRAVVTAAKAEGAWVRGYVSTAFGCPFEGAIPTAAVTSVVASLSEAGIDEISVGDTIGVATPNDVERVVTGIAAATAHERIALHFHDTRGTALVNVFAALGLGIRIFDSSAGGLGGCPYAPGATGNLATEDLVYLLEGLGIESGVDLEKLRAAVAPIAQALNRKLASRVHNAPVWRPHLPT